MKNKAKKSYGKRIVAGLLVAIMLLLETVAIFATELDTTTITATNKVLTEDTFESVMSEEFRITLNDDFVSYPTTVPELINSSNKIYPHIVSELKSGYTATYRSEDDLFTVTFENPTDKPIDTNKAIVRSILITPQMNTVIKMSGLTIENETNVTVADLTKVLGPYNNEVTIFYENNTGVLIWDFDKYSIQITLDNGFLYDILVTSKEDSLPNVSKKSFYNFESAEYYKIEVFENKINIGTSLATTFYVTKEEKDNMESRLFFDLYINNVYPMGYLLQDETIDDFNTDNDYETILAELSEKMELDYYSNNATFITKSDTEIERENNIRYVVTASILALAVTMLITHENRKKREKLKRELYHQKEE